MTVVIESRIAAVVAIVLVLIALSTGCVAVGETSAPMSGASSTGAPIASSTLTSQSPGVDEPTTSSAAEVSLEALSGRAAHSATTLPTGEVLVVGGCITDGCGVATAETFLVASDGQAVVRGPDLFGPRDGHTANILSDGSVAFIAGYSGEGQPPLGSVEVYDLTSGDIRSLGDLDQPRGGHASAVLEGDRVLVLGGWIARATYTASTEIVDIAAGSVTAAASLPLALHAMDAVTLSDGSVLVSGGQIEGGAGTDRAWRYDPRSDAWLETGPMLERRFKHFSVLLADGKVLVIGGTTDDEEILATTEIYDPVTDRFTEGPELIEPRYKLPGGAVLLDEDRVLVGGGGRTVEIIDLNSGTSSLLEDLGSEGSFATTTALGNGEFLVLGGYDRSIELRRQVRLIRVS